MLFAFVCTFVLYFHFSKPISNYIVGTYATNDGKTPDAEYLVFEKDGAYTHYKQFVILDEGVYAQSSASKRTYVLTADSGKERNAVLKGVVLTLDDIEFRKISDVPTFINLPDK